MTLKFQKLYFTSLLYFILGFLVFIVYIFDDMAEAATRLYNLRSREEAVELPVQLGKFLTQILQLMKVTVMH